MPLVLAAVAHLSGSSHCPLHFRSVTGFLGWSGVAKNEAAGRSRLLLRALLSRHHVVTQPSREGRQNLQRTRGAGVASKDWLPSFLFLFFALFLFPSFACCYQFSQTETASATKWAEGPCAASRDRAIHEAGPWRLGSMVIMTPKSDPQLVTRAASLFLMEAIADCAKYTTSVCTASQSMDVDVC
ncbi:hypothetical protein J3F83DRAFT_10505 [Trichoderma novae-zelandiae]